MLEKAQHTLESAYAELCIKSHTAVEAIPDVASVLTKRADITWINLRRGGVSSDRYCLTILCAREQILAKKKKKECNSVLHNL